MVKEVVNIRYDAISGTVGVPLTNAVIPTLNPNLRGGTFADTDSLGAATGLTFNTGTGAISGTPRKAVTTAREFTVTYTPSSADQANYKTTPIEVEVSITIAKGTISVSYAVINGRVGDALSVSYDAINGRVGVALNLPVIPALTEPDGFAGRGTFADTDGLAGATGLTFNTRTGVISGTPRKAVSTEEFTVTYTPSSADQANYGNTQIEVSISIAKGTISVSYGAINGRVGVALNLPVIPALTEPDGFAGGGTFADTDGLVGATGLTFNTSTGTISGTPRKAVSTRTFTVTYTPSVADQANYGTTSIEVSITIDSN